MNMETYRGQVKTPNDAIILFEACRLGNLPRVQRRLSEKERQTIGSGSVFVWDEREAGMRRWTDGKSWSASRVSGSFLTYREMEGRRGGSAFNSPATGTGLTNGSDAMDASGEAPDGYRYKPDGLVKQSFSITTSTGQHLHLISYYARSDPGSARLPTPSTDRSLAHIRPEKGMYPEATVNETPEKPAVTRSPMNYSPYGTSPSQPQTNHYLRHPPPKNPGGYSWASSPLSSPATNFTSYPSNAYASRREPGSNSASPMFQSQQFPPTSNPVQGQTAFDRLPPNIRGAGVPPPPPPAPPQPYPQHQPPYSHQPAPNATYPANPSPNLRSPEYRSPEPYAGSGHDRAMAPPRNSYIDQRNDPHHPSNPSLRGPAPPPEQHVDARQAPAYWNSSGKSQNNPAATEDNKRIPSINSIMNKTSPVPLQRSLLADSGQGPDPNAQYNASRTEAPQGERPLSGIKDVGAGKAFGEDSRALRKLDRAFAM